MRVTKAITGKCPHCMQGEIFASFWRMHEHCPVCDVKFEREPGYFLMAIFIGYILSFAIVIPVLLALHLTVKLSIWGYVIAATVTLSVAAPFIFRYGRIIWMHIDELLDPRVTEADKKGELPPPHGIDLMLTHENETADHWYQRKSEEQEN